MDAVTVKVHVHVKNKGHKSLFANRGENVRIGEIAEESGVSTRALRYYEEQGLLVPQRTPSGQRFYHKDAAERVTLIQQLFAAGLSSRVIQQLLPFINSGTGAAESMSILQHERDSISTKMRELAAARDALDVMISIAENPTPEHCPALR